MIHNLRNKKDECGNYYAVKVQLENNTLQHLRNPAKCALAVQKLNGLLLFIYFLF